MDRDNKKNGLLTITARFIKYNQRLIIVIAVFIILIYMAVFGNKGILQRFRLESERKELQNQLDEEIKRTEQLQKEIEDLNDSDEKIEKVAREKYGMTKEGEKVYKIIIDSVKKDE